MNAVYGYIPDSPNCNPHTFSEASSEGCAWVEGWPNFFQGAVRNNASYNDGDIDSGASFDLESELTASGEDVEGNAAKSLWDIFDDQQINDNFNDDFQTSFNNIFNSFRDLETSYNGSENGENVDVIREFWINWFQYYNNQMQMNRIFYYNGINYNNNPYQSAILTQYKSDGSTTIAIGGLTNDGTVVMKGNISDPDEDDVRLEVEVRSVGVPFSNTTTCVSGSAVASGNNASANCSGLADGQYHWQARANDSYGAIGNWLSAGGNPESSPDLIIDTTLNNWQYNRKLTITGSTSGAQTNYQMKLTVYNTSGTDAPGIVYLNGSARSDFGDLRFTKSDGVTLLDYWVESYTPGTSAVVWVEVDSIPASPNSTSIYLYYGNSSATGVSSGAGTFLFFDDFNDLNNWSTDISPNYAESLSASVSNGEVTILTSTSNSNPNGSYAVKKTGSSFGPNAAIRTRYGDNTTTHYPGGFGFGVYSGSPPGSGTNTVQKGIYTRSKFLGMSAKNGTIVTSGPNAYDNSYYLWDLIWTSNKTELIRNGASLWSNTNIAAIPAVPLKLGMGDMGQYGGATGTGLKADWILVRNCVYPEPAWT